MGHTLLYTTNNAYDTVLLVDEAGTILSAWTVDDKVLAGYLREGRTPDEWEVAHNVEDDLRVGDYGEEIGRNGDLPTQAQ